MGEIWKPIEGYPGYMVSSAGRVKGKKKILKQINCIEGRLKVVLYNSFGKPKMFFVSRLVALAFVPNKENKPYVDHIDRNVKNNTVENLRWVNQSENLLNKNTVKYRSMMIGDSKAVDIAIKNNIPKETFYRRIRNGRSVSEASILPPKKYTFRKRSKKKGLV